MRCQIVLALVLLAAHGCAQVQAGPAAPSATPSPPPKFAPPTRLPAELVRFFSGAWHGEGQFAGGKKLEADASFAPDLDNQWLVYRHHDRAPNQYQTLGV